MGTPYKRKLILNFSVSHTSDGLSVDPPAGPIQKPSQNIHILQKYAFRTYPEVSLKITLCAIWELRADGLEDLSQAVLRSW